MSFLKYFSSSYTCYNLYDFFKGGNQDKKWRPNEARQRARREENDINNSDNDVTLPEKSDNVPENNLSLSENAVSTSENDSTGNESPRGTVDVKFYYMSSVLLLNCFNK